MIFFLLLACTGEIDKETCDELCDQLVQECEYGAYPSYESCQQGCAYEEAEGGDVRGMQGCIEKAGCDTFGILECEHKFGLSAAGEDTEEE